MTLKELKENFLVEKDEANRYLLFNPVKNSGKNLNQQFYCVVEKVGNTFKIIPSEHVKNPMEFITDVYTHINVFKHAVEKYVELLPYHSDFYYPNNRPCVFHLLAVNEFMKNLGFKNSKSDDSYIFEQKNVYRGNLNVINISIDGLNMTSDNSFIQISSEKDADSIVLALNNLLKPLFLTNGIQNIELSDKLNFEDFEPTDNRFNLSTLSLKSASYKQELREKLEQILEKLK